MSLSMTIERAKQYRVFEETVKRGVLGMQLQGFTRVQPTWLDDQHPFLAFIDGVRDGQPLRLRVETGFCGYTTIVEEATPRPVVGVSA